MMKDIISKRRKELGMTQQELANKLFISDKVVSKWETGKSIPDTSILVDLSKALEISLENLLESKEVNELSNKKTQEVMFDRLEVKFNNIMLVSYLLLVLFLIFFIIGRIIYFKDYYRKNEVLVWIFYAISFSLISISIAYYLISKNKLSIDYPSIYIIEKKKMDNYINFIAICVAICIFTYFFTNDKSFSGYYQEEHFLEQFLSAIIIIAIIEIPLYLLLKYFIKKNY